MDYRPCLHKIFQFFLCLIFMKNWEVGRLHLNCALTTHISWRRNCKWDVDYCLIFFAKRPKLSHSELNSTDHAVERQSLAFCQISFQCRNFWNSLISLVCFSFSLFFHSFCFLLSRFWSYSFFRTWLFFNWQTVCFLGTKMIYISIYVGRRHHKNEMKFIQLQLT